MSKSALLTTSRLTTLYQPTGLDFSSNVIAQAVLDCRIALLHVNDVLSAELVPSSNDGIIDTAYQGVIFIKLSLESSVESTQQEAQNIRRNPLEVEKIEDSLRISEQYMEKLNFEQYQKMKAWYATLRSRHPFIVDRKIKMLALDEFGRHRMVCNFVGAVPPSRSVDNPRFAARFVSLLPFHHRSDLLGGLSNENFQSPFVTCMCKQGDVVAHALLLCSLLLGWGLDAWVAYGTIFPPSSTVTERGGENIVCQPHYWVVTLDSLSSLDTNMSSSSSTSSSGEDSTTIIFWESLTGQQFNIPVLQSRPFSVSYGTGRKDDLHVHDSSSLFPTHPFNHIYAMFRHDRMAINLQTRPGLSSATSLNDGSNIDNRACFDLTDSRYWACFSNPEHAMLKHPGSSLLPSLIAQSGSSNLQQQQSATLSPSFLLEVGIEDAVKECILNLRTDAGLQSFFDEQLAIILQPALLAYEWDRAVGCSFGSADFQQSIKRNVRKREVFKAYPTCFSHTHIPSLLASLKRVKAFKDVALSGQLGVATTTTTTITDTAKEESGNISETSSRFPDE
eukprot:gene29379-38464_t